MDTLQSSLAHKGQIKDIRNTLENKYFFDKNPKLSVIYKKTEKLTTAIYMITDFFDVQEPLRWELRNKSVSLLSFITGRTRGDYAIASAEQGLALAAHMLQEILFPLRVAVQVHLISQMNFSIIREEYLSLSQIIDQCRSDGSLMGDFLFPEHFFVGLDTEKSFLTDTLSQSEKRLLYTKRQGNESNGQKNDNGEFVNSRYKSEDNHKNSLGEMGAGFISQAVPKKEERVNRREVIKRLLRSRGALTIKDILMVMPQHSEKTVQRELLSLVAQGGIKKLGERRWSKYTIA
ncbi:MAG TPA: hypothetical protein VJB70_01890 [Candidatus Paceibacterota bacterium]